MSRFDGTQSLMTAWHPTDDLYALEGAIGEGAAEIEIYGSKSYRPKCDLTLPDGSVLRFDEEDRGREMQEDRITASPPQATAAEILTILDEYEKQCRRTI